mgnify:CR=1 FL=1
MCANHLLVLPIDNAYYPKGRVEQLFLRNGPFHRCFLLVSWTLAQAKFPEHGHHLKQCWALLCHLQLIPKKWIKPNLLLIVMSREKAILCFQERRISVIGGTLRRQIDIVIVQVQFTFDKDSDDRSSWMSLRSALVTSTPCAMAWYRVGLKKLPPGPPCTSDQAKITPTRR